MKTNLIGLSGYIGSGKNTVASIIQYLVWKKRVENGEMPLGNYSLDNFISAKYYANKYSGWEQKAFAGKLKQIASILTGIPVENFEDQEFKKTLLGEEWGSFTFIEYWINDNYATFEGEVLFSKKEEMNKYALDMGHTDNTCSQGSFRRLSAREFLQKLGTEAIRNNIHPNAWVNALFADYRPNYGNPMTEAVHGHGSDMSWHKWIITDCRFPNEAQAIKDRGGIVVRVDRGESTSAHPSETSLDSWEFDYTIHNNGTIDDLVENVEMFLREFKII